MDPARTLQAGVDPTTVAIGVLTQLGDTWFLALVVVVAYWLVPHRPAVDVVLDRDRAATVVGLLLFAVALSVGLKAWFAVERPGAATPAPTVPAFTVESVVAWLTGAQGYAFPSGHGVVATAGWGGLAWAVRRGSPGTRATVAAVVVLAVGASRVALGVHTPVQVVAGIGVGLVALVAVIVRSRPLWAFGLAVVAGAVGTVAVGPLPDLLAVTGLAAGGGLAWYRWRGSLCEPTGDWSGPITALVGVLTVLPALAGLTVVEPPSAVSVLAGAVAGGALVALPLVGRRLTARLG